MEIRIDHLVVGSATLEQGVEFVRDRLGVEMPFGGVHEKLGTHNHLMQLGDEVFLEIIAVHPGIEPPDRPRWFGLDDALIRRRIEMQPALLTWVVQTDNLKALKQQAAFSLGEPELITRGELSWYFGLPRDGRLLAGGMLPYAIEWQTDKHPSSQMADLGCRLQQLEVYHPYPAWFGSALGSIGGANLVEINPLPRYNPPYLQATISTPNGIRQLSSAYSSQGL